MKKTVTMFSAAVFSLLSASAYMAFAQEVQKFPQNLLTRAFLEARTWKNDSTLEMTLASWKAYDCEQGFDDRPIRKTSRVQILDVTFRAEYRVMKKDPVAEIIFIAEDFLPVFCSQSLEWLSGYYGKPRRTVDLSSSNVVDVQSEWLMGETRVHLVCSGVKYLEKFFPAGGVLAYRHKEFLPELKEPAYINCSGSRKFVGKFADGKVQADKAMTLIIEPNRQRMLTRDKQSLGTVTKWSEDEIIVSWEMKDNNQVFLLDRLAGTYQHRFRLKEDARTGIDAWGECSKIPTEQKF